MFLLDSHTDAPTMLCKGADFSKNIKQGFGFGSFPVTHIDYPRLKRGGVNGVFFAIYTSNYISEAESSQRAFEMISKVYDSVAQNGDKVAFATNAAQARRNQKNGLISIFLGLENGLPIGNDLSKLRMFYRLGVRYVTLTHAGHNAICDSCAPAEPKWGGVSPFGREVIAEMNNLGMLIDVSHISDDSFWDVLKYSNCPVVATHSCCRALANHKRNMSDDMIRALADNGGVIQINFYPSFIDEEFCQKYGSLIDEIDDIEMEWRKDQSNPDLIEKLRCGLSKLDNIQIPSYKRIVDHIDHAVQLVGYKHVGIGSDFDGFFPAPKGLEDVSKMQKIIIELRKRGYKEYEIDAIAGGNFLRLLNNK